MSSIYWSDGPPADDWAVQDATRLQRVAKEHGVEWTLEEAFRNWEDLSWDCDAGWLIMPKADEELWASWSNFVKRVKDVRASHR